MRLFKQFNRTVKLILLWNILFCFGLSVYMVLYNLYLMEFLTLKKIGTISGTSYISFAVFSVIGGILADRIGPRKVLQIGILVIIIGFIGGLTSESQFVLCMWAIIFGMGQAFTNVMFVPLLTEHSNEEDRVKLFSFAFGTGNLFMFFGTLSSGMLAKKLASIFSITNASSFQTVISAAAVVIFVSGIPLLFIRTSSRFRKKKERQRVSRKENRIVFSFAGIKLIEGIGSGFSIPFINLFLANRFDLDSSEISLFMSGAVFVTVVMIFVNPYITAKFGEVKVLFAFQALGIPCLVMLGFSINIWICAACFLCFRALLFARMPIQSKILMQKAPLSIRGVVNSVGFMASSIGVGIAGPISMSIVSKLGNYYGYGLLFSAAGICFGISVYLFYYFFERQNKSSLIVVEKLAN